MTKQEKLTNLLNERVIWPRMVSPEFSSTMGFPWENRFSNYPDPRPSVEQLADELLGIAEVRALRLGAWLTTPDGEMIAQAVEAMSPPLYRQDVELLVAALQLAAKRQQLEGQERAGKFAVGAIGVATAVAIGIAEYGTRAA